MSKKLELQMYGLVPYNISPIQQAIQFGHATVAYGQIVKYCGDPQLLDQYNDWADNYKTFIILNGGTSNHSVNRYVPSEDYIGSMETHLTTLEQMGIDLATFYEPDLNDLLSAIVFIVDERVFNRELYPDFEDWVVENHSELINSDTVKRFSSNGITSYQLSKLVKESDVPEDKKVYQEWLDLIGGKKNEFLREFLHPRNFKKA